MFSKKFKAALRSLSLLPACIGMPILAYSQDVLVSGAGEATANQSFKEVGSAAGKPQFQGNTTTTVYIEWDGSAWILYDTGNGTYYVNDLDTPLPPWDFWQESKASGPPTLSGPRVSYPLAGVYTVGGASPDFATLSAAVDSLNNHGIADDVGFVVRNGTYDEQIGINAFPRYGGSTDSVVFRPESGTVTWTYTGAGVSNNWIVKIDGADHVTFNGFEFETPIGPIDYGRIVYYGNVDDLLFKNCVFDGRPNAVGIAQTLVDYFSAANGDLTFFENHFANGYEGLSTAGTVVVGDNTFIQQETVALKHDSGTAPRVFDNSISDYSQSSASFIGMSVVGASAEIDRNHVEVTMGETGISVDGSGAKVRNNMVTMSASSINAGIVLGGESTNRVLFNTVLVLDSSAGAALRTGVMPSQFVVISNIFYNLGAGPTMIVDANDIFSDHNNLYTSGPVFVQNYSTGSWPSLADWQAAYGQDDNSVSKTVTFVATTSPPDLHLSGGSVGDTDLGGLLYGEVTTDFDGETRSVLAPYMGADEATALNMGFELTLSFNLEGPWSVSAMGTELNSGGFLAANALSHPYSGSPWHYSGSESVPNGAFFSSHPNVVDWVYVRLYSGDVNTTVVPDADAVGLLENDGGVISVTGASSLTLNPSGPGDYYVAVFHRNHIPAITALPITISYPGSVAASVNFNTASKYGTNPMKNLGGGKWALWACDADADGLVTAPDFNAWTTATSAGETGYLAVDCNMDGDVTAPDFNFWNANTTAGASSQIPD